MTDQFEFHNDRAVISLSGPERKSLLQGIITNDVNRLNDNHAVYAALLSPQGKFLHDFFLFEKDEIIYLDCEKENMADLFRRLLMYRLRSAVEIIDRSADYKVITSTGPITDQPLSFKDPRHDQIGYRAIIQNADITGDKSYHKRRITLGIPQGTHDFIVDKSTIGEGHFEQLDGVDFEKGCYVGQEVTARMKYRGTIKKAIFPVTLSGPAPQFGTAITDQNDKKVGDIRSSCGDKALALFRLKDMTFGEDYNCGEIKITPYKPDWYKDIKDDG